MADSGKTYALNFSLKGFAAAHDDMVSQAKAKAKPVAKPAARPPRRDAVKSSCNTKKAAPSRPAFFVRRGQAGLNVIATPFMQ